MNRQNPKLTLSLLALVAVTIALTQNGEAQDATKMVQDRQIAAALQQVSAQHIQENIAKLVGFGTRLTLSAQDPESVAKGRAD